MFSLHTMYELAPFVVIKSLIITAALFLVLSAVLLLRAARSYRDADGASLLHRLAHATDHWAARLLGRALLAGPWSELRVFANAAAPTGLTALHAAASKDHEHWVRLLLQAGADADAVDHQGRSPLAYAAAAPATARISHEGSARSIAVLLSAGADQHLTDGRLRYGEEERERRESVGLREKGERAREREREREREIAMSQSG